MLPPRKIPMDWDGEIECREEFDGELSGLRPKFMLKKMCSKDIFSFMSEDFTEETMATIVEVQNELPSRED
jgi:hypothetical protein